MFPFGYDDIGNCGISFQEDDVYNGRLSSHFVSSVCQGKIMPNKYIFLTLVLIDITPPIPGSTVDGLNLAKDISFSSEMATKSVSWENFTDLESGIDRYQVTLYKNNEKVKTFASTTEMHFTDYSVSMDHEDKIMFEVETFNRAGLSVCKKNRWIHH